MKTNWLHILLHILFLILNGNWALFGQTPATILSDRPGQALSAFTPGKKVWQLQQGFDYYKKQINNTTSTVLMNNVARYGINHKTEFNAVVDFQHESNPSVYQLSTVQVGVRRKITTQKNWRPNIAGQIRLIDNIWNAKNVFNNIDAEGSLISNWDLGNGFGLSAIG